MSKVKDQFASINYFKGIDVLRFICATGVIFHHTTSILNNKGVQTKAEFIHRNSGPYFLDVFFIISGFLISLILMKEYQQGTFSIKNFYLRRIIRIWPLYFLVVLVKVLIVPIIQHYPMEFIVKDLLYACSFTINFQLLIETITPAYTILWSICIEEHIYLLLPLLLFIFKGKFKIIGWFLILSGFISWAYFKGVPSISGLNTPYFTSSCYFLFFGIGVLLAYLYNQGTKLKLLFLPPVQSIFLIIIMLFVFNITPQPSGLIKILLVYGLTGGYLVWAAAQENFIIKIGPAFSKYLGNISYGMYITHIMIVTPVVKYFVRSDMKFSEALFGWGIPCITTLLTMAVATLLYYSFERPILKLKKRFTTVETK